MSRARGGLLRFFSSRPFRAQCIFHLPSYWYSRGVMGKIIATLIRNYISASYGCYVSPLAKFTGSYYLPHPVGIVIGDGSVIRGGVTIYQNVTIGRKFFDEVAYPEIGDNVVIYAGAVIVGGISIGEGCLVGANAVVNVSVPDFCMAVGVPAKIKPLKYPFKR